MRTAQFEVVAGHFGDQAYQQVAAGGFQRGDFRGAGLDGPADPAEEVKFPSGVKAGVVQRQFTLVAGERDRLGVFAGQRPRVAPVGVDGGGEIEDCGGPERAGFANAGGRDAQIVICRGGEAAITAIQGL